MIVAIAAVMLLAACPDGPLMTCTDELSMRISPLDTTIAVGQGFTPTVNLTTCGGRRQLDDDFSFEAENPLVAEVNAGRITAKSRGTTSVAVKGTKYGRLIDIVVRVP